jgi:hypothetical protein
MHADSPEEAEDVAYVPNEEEHKNIIRVLARIPATTKFPVCLSAGVHEATCTHLLAISRSERASRRSRARDVLYCDRLAVAETGLPITVMSNAAERPDHIDWIL